MSRNKLGQFITGAPSERRRNWVGERFGKLEVVGVEYGVMRGSRERTICTCKCDCGNIIETVSDYLRQGKKTSCGCDTSERRIKSNRVDLTGKRFGRLVVEEMLWVYPHTKCRCKCDCGNDTIVINTGLTSGKTTSCGCAQRDRTSEANTKDFTDVVTETGIRILNRSRQSDRGVWIWKCLCPVCGNTFEAIPAKLISAGQISCGCSLLSKGEMIIKSYLEEHNIKYVPQYSFEKCKSKYKLRFDFAIFNNENRLMHLIEFDGMQHYTPVDHFGGDREFARRKKNDAIKDTFCSDNHIPLTRMPYTMSSEEIKDTIKNIINP